MKKSVLLVLPVAAAVAAGGANAAVHSAARTTLHTNANPHGLLEFTKSKLSAPAGRVTIKMKNPKGTFTDHGIAIQIGKTKKKGKIVSPGGSSSVTAKLKKGTYTFYCPVSGHRAAGMKGKLTVK
jgi:uncharacterized cupredoxin-like copper-binding protein